MTAFHFFCCFCFVLFFLNILIQCFLNPRFLMRNLLIILLRIPCLCVMTCFCFIDFKILSLPLVFDSWIITCLNVGLFELILLGIIKLLGCFYFCLLSDLRMWVHYYSNNFSNPFFFLSSFGVFQNALIDSFYGLKWFHRNLKLHPFSL